MCGMCGTQRLGGRGDRVITCKPKSRCRRTALCNKMQHQAQGTKSAPACIRPPQTSSCVPSIDQTRQNVNVTGLLYCDTALLGKNNPEGGQTGRNVLHPCKPPATYKSWQPEERNDPRYFCSLVCAAQTPVPLYSGCKATKLMPMTRLAETHGRLPGTCARRDGRPVTKING